MDLAEAVWSCATAAIDSEDSDQRNHKLVVQVDVERLAELGFDVDESIDEISDVVYEIPDVYEPSDLTFLEFNNTAPARRALLARGVAIEVYDVNGIHYTLKPGGDVVVENGACATEEGLGL